MRCAAADARVAERFVERLSAEGHADLVEAYLERAGDDPLVSEEFKQQIPWRRAAARFGQAAKTRDAEKRRDALQAIAESLRPLAGESDGAANALLDVEERLAITLADLAHRDAAQAQREVDPDVRRNRQATAERRLDEARDALRAVEQTIVQAREGLKGAQPTSPDGLRRRDLGARLGVVRLLAGRLLYELAESHPPESAERRRIASDAAKELYELYGKYSQLGVGLYAHLYEARAYRLTGEAALATAALEDLTAQPTENPELRKIVTLAYAELAALALDLGKPADALAKPAEWLENLPRSEQATLEAATLQYRLGIAALASAEGASATDAKRLRRDARDWLGASARVASEVQADARRRWTEVTAELGLDSRPPESFDEAFAAAKEAIAAMTAADLQLAEADAASAEQLTAQRRDSRDAAYTALRAAGDLVDRRTEPDSVAEARYLLAFLDWDAGQHADAAERAESIARQQSDTSSGPKAARLALAALEQLSRSGEDVGPRLTELARFTADKWPGSPAAGAAATVLLSEALRAGDFAAADEALADAPADARPGFNLRIALARYEAAAGDKAQELERLRSALGEAAGGAEPSPLAASAALQIALAALQNGDAATAKSLLNHSSYGPATLAAAGKPPADTPAFAVTALSAAARADLSSGGDAKVHLDALRERLAAAPAEATGGDAVWLRLAAHLAEDIKRAPERWRDRVAGGLAEALRQLDSYQATADWNTRLWIAQAWTTASQSLPRDGRAEAAARACDALSALVDKAGSQAGFAPSPTAVLAAQLRLAECQRQRGDYSAALETSVDLLSGGRVLLEAQQAAAATLQEWGAAERDPARIEQAIAGARPGEDGNNVVWGWSKLAAIAGRYAASDPARRAMYFDAWRRVAESRYQAALLANGAERDSQLGKAAATIVALQRQNPDLGGDDSRRAFDTLLKQIQQAAGDPPSGLPASSG